MIRRLRTQRGFTLVELMIVVAIIGILAALAVYGVKRYMTSAKTAEAREQLGRISKDATSAYQRESMAGTILSLTNGATGATHALCPEAAPLPDAIPSAQKVQTAPSDWSGDPGWACLKFSMSDPQYYQYDYSLKGTDGFEAIANGDLDGDGEESKFVLEGKVEQGEARTAPTIQETLPDE